jgi:hypothetical protein
MSPQSSDLMKTCVVITEFAPIPKMGGSNLRIASTVTALGEHFKVHVICLDTDSNLVREATQFCCGLGVTLTHAPSAFGLTGRKSFSKISRYFIGSLSPTLEHLSLRKLPQEILQILGTADLVWVFKQSPFRYRHVPIEIAARLILDVDDIEERVVSERTDSPRWVRRLMARKIRHSRNRLFEFADVSLVCSDLDATRLDAPCAVRVLPNTYPAASATLPSKTCQFNRALMIGIMNYFPNTDGMTWYLDNVWDQVRRRVPEARMTVAGRASDELFKSDPSRGIDVIGRFDDPTPLLADASVVVVPLRHGSGTRLKILEAFAYGLPVVSTTIGAEGLDVVNGESILIADDPAEFAQHVVNLFEDRDCASRIAAGGTALFRAKYSPEVFSSTVLQIAHSVLTA